MLAGMCVTWLHSRDNDITPWPGSEWEKSIHSFVGGELSFQKLGSVLVGLSGTWPAQPKLLF